VAAEDIACRFLEALGWQVLARNLIVGRDEIDLVCLDEGVLVCVEVRGHATSRFGAAEESVDRRKLARNHRAAMTLIRSGWRREQGLPTRVNWRVDVVAVELRPALCRDMGGPTVRHIQGVTLD